MKSAEIIAEIEMAIETGRFRHKEQIIKSAEDWCNTLVDSAAFRPSQRVTNGQVKTANELLEYLKK